MGDLYVLKTSLVDALKPKRLAIATCMILLPALAALIWRAISPASRYDSTEVYNTLAAYFIFGFSLNILAVIYGTGALAAEIEGRTIVYLLTRPIPRWRLLLMKMIGAWLGITMTVLVSTLLLGLAAYAGKPDWARMGADLRVLPLGALAYSCLFLFFATLLPRPLIWALLYGFGWENIAAFFPGGFARLSILSYLRTLSPHLKEVLGAGGEGDGADLSSLILQSTPARITQPIAWGAISGIIVVTLVLALVCFNTREYVPREEGA